MVTLRSSHLRKIAEVLGLPFSEPSYYRDIYVWLPDVRWAAVEAMPCCSNGKMGFHGWRDSHHGRRITDMNTNYFALSRRYVCHGCKASAMLVKKEAMLILEDHGMQVIEEDDDHNIFPSYTFMGWYKASLSYLPYGYGDIFPAFLTHRSGVDKHIVDLMRSPFVKGVGYCI